MNKATSGSLHHFVPLQDIVILQEVYGHLMMVYKKSLAEFVVDDRDDDGGGREKTPAGKGHGDPHEQVIFFVIECLSNLITKKGSVLSAWALDPSIFHVFTRHSNLMTRKFAARYPWLHGAVLGAFHVHCSTNGHFLSSSSLVHSSSAPTAEHFKDILETISGILEQVNWGLVLKQICCSVQGTRGLGVASQFNL